ncbi:MAG TPA: FtsK/SpoIIIE domain-containing protein [Gemmataceae bacterium]|nr:FtsK/SpoIIIE domain-containing protein [Gemmataceae bacterium]
MGESPLVSRQRVLLHDLAQLVAERAKAEPQVERQFKTDTQAAEHEFEVDFQTAIVRFAAEKEASEREFEDARRTITARFEADSQSTEREFSAARQKIVEEYETAKQQAKNEFQETRWTIAAILEGIKNGTDRQLKDAKMRNAEGRKRLDAARDEATELLRACRQSRVLTEQAPESAPASADDGDPFDRFDQCLETAEAKTYQLKKLRIPRLFRGERLLWMWLALWLLGFVLSGFLFGRLYGSLLGWVYGLTISTISVLLMGAGLSLWLYRVARNQISRHYRLLAQAVAEADVLLERCRAEVTEDIRRQLARGRKRHHRDFRQGKEKYQHQLATLKQRRTEAWSQVSATYRRERAEIQQRRDTDLFQATEKFEQLRTAIQQRYENASRRARERRSAQLATCQSAYEAEWNRIENDWRNGLEQVRSAVAEINTESSERFHGWSESSWSSWLPGSSFPPAIRFGEYQVGLNSFPDGEPRHPRLKSASLAPFTLPALVSFPHRFAMQIAAQDEGRTLAVEILQTVMFRLMTAIPPGKVRFTIIDPVGLGQNFASFMHLADYDEALVTSRIWTELSHIEQRLADLTGHMENVIQKYLRNQFETIEDYNAHAGEVAEPYRILVVANFPVNFSVEAARRLVSILQSGPRCGVYTLLSIDTKQPMPQGFNPKDLEQAGADLRWQGDHFLWQDKDFERFALHIDAAPPAELCNRILQVVGDKAREAKRVEVPFEFVAPSPDLWWTADSRSGISVPLGRVGATGRQHLKLGQGTAQHVLVAGKTGSGKSTLLHALISNLALLYSPAEVELYLVDFKKGVEFKTYATHALPHARVVAVESEREFGLSVLQRLDAELKLRGDRFREVGAQNLSAYRQADPGRPTPRILLIVDEFQEFFVEDDKIAQDAALLLDRLVRQGRAFGLHVLLGSQTLGGAYTLARSTIDQMAVRIALQCSEADGHIILSDDNSAARLLSRPGEAIYNDANGLVEGNNPFQVVWLDDDRRERYLREIQNLARQHNLDSVREQIVFEGNAPSDVAQNPVLRQRLLAPSWPKVPPTEAFAWLGEAVAIKDPTAACFRPQSGNNLLIIGQNGEAARGILATALIGLAAQYPPVGDDFSARFYLLDGSPDDALEAGFLASLAGYIPHPLRIIAWRELSAAIGELADMIEQRQQARTTDAPAVYLFVHGLQRFRDLRKQEDDFGFSRREEKPNPAKQFGTILREGPAVGVHTLVWCDSFNNLNRAFDRQTLREFELRVLFQMSATDSSNLIDTPLASKLGIHRALFHSEEQGRMEKFRPYGLPAEPWLLWVKEQLGRRGSV